MSKYKPTKEEKQELKILFRYLIRVIVVLVVIKIIRLLIISNEGINNYVSNYLYHDSIYLVFKFFAQFSLISGVVSFCIVYSVFGIKILLNKYLLGVFIFLCLDMLYIYFYPELLVAVLRALFSSY